MTSKQTTRAFSLVEVTLSIGIVSFALLSVAALLPIGLQTVKNATEQATGSATLAAISEALRHARTDDGTTYRVAIFGTNSFTKGGPVPEPWLWQNITLEGAEDPDNRRVVARLQILETPSSDGLRPGRAVASVAWSAHGNPSVDSETQAWNNAEGSISAPLQFLPSTRP